MLQMTMDMSRPALIHGLSRDVYQDIKNKTTGTSSAARTAYPSGEPEFTPVEIRVASHPSGAPEFTPVEIRLAPHPSGAPEFTPVEIRVATYPSGAPEFTPVGIRVAQSLLFCLVFCISLFIMLSISFHNCIVCSVSDLCFLVTPWYFQTFF